MALSNFLITLIRCLHALVAAASSASASAAGCATTRQVRKHSLLGQDDCGSRSLDCAQDEEIFLQVTFLYELKEGACPKSYGTACARLAGMPESILARAEHLAAELEAATLPCAASSDQKAGVPEHGAPGCVPGKCMRSLTECLGNAHQAPGVADLQELQAAVKVALALNQKA